MFYCYLTTLFLRIYSIDFDIYKRISVFVVTLRFSIRFNDEWNFRCSHTNRLTHYNRILKEYLILNNLTKICFSISWSFSNFRVFDNSQLIFCFHFIRFDYWHSCNAQRVNVTQNAIVKIIYSKFFAYTQDGNGFLTSFLWFPMYDFTARKWTREIRFSNDWVWQLCV